MTTNKITRENGITVDQYYQASDVRGLHDRFGDPITVVRVRLVEWVGTDAVVITADLRDAGTHLLLAAAQLTPMEKSSMEDYGQMLYGAF